MVTKPKEDVWVAVADAGKVRLLHCTVVPPGRCHVEETARIANKDAGYQHGRPQPRAGKLGTSGVTHENEEELRRFAKETTTWLNAQAQRRQVDELTLFAPPRLLGALRSIPDSLPDGVVRQREADLTNLDNSKLSEHPLIRELLRCP